MKAITVTFTGTTKINRECFLLSNSDLYQNILYPIKFKSLNDDTCYQGQIYQKHSANAVTYIQENCEPPIAKLLCHIARTERLIRIIIIIIIIIIILLLHNLVEASFDLFRYLLLGNQLKPWELGMLCNANAC